MVEIAIIEIGPRARATLAKKKVQRAVSVIPRHSLFVSRRSVIAFGNWGTLLWLRRGTEIHSIAGLSSIADWILHMPRAAIGGVAHAFAGTNGNGWKRLFCHLKPQSSEISLFDNPSLETNTRLHLLNLSMVRMINSRQATNGKANNGA
jgi:hypothetical protein